MLGETTEIPRLVPDALISVLIIPLQTGRVHTNEAPRVSTASNRILDYLAGQIQVGYPLAVLAFQERPCTIFKIANPAFEICQLC